MHRQKQHYSTRIHIALKETFVLRNNCTWLPLKCSAKTFIKLVGDAVCYGSFRALSRDVYSVILLLDNINIRPTCQVCFAFCHGCINYQLVFAYHLRLRRFNGGISQQRINLMEG